MADFQVLNVRVPAATAGTQIAYLPVPNTFIVQGYGWFYESAEANVDNTLDFAIEQATDGSSFTEVKTNANANGLLDTAAVLAFVNRKADAAVAGQTAVNTPAFAEVTLVANSVLRFTIVTAGTGTIPAIHLCVYGRQVGPFARA